MALSSRQPIFDAVRQMLGRGFTNAEVKALDRAIDAAQGVLPPVGGLSSPDAFFSALRASLGPLNQSQVDGFNRLLGAMGAARWPLAWAAYGLATAWHETAFRMQPVVEAYWLSEDWRRRNLRYYPWHGRGDVQLTWEPNYRRADEELGLGGSLIANPDRAMEPEISARILVKGMAAGWFTNKKLSDYLPSVGGATSVGYRNARRIINGTDKAAKIAEEALAIEAALTAGGWA